MVITSMLNNLHKKSKLYYSWNRKDILKLIPGNIERLLDVGCGKGLLGKYLKKSGIKTVVGIELIKEAEKIAKKHLDKVYIGDIENKSFPIKKEYFDCIICGDILEHLIDPYSVLLKLKSYLKKDGILIISIPNVQHYSVIYRLILGKWDYEESGILDKTHLRFFTLKTIKDLLVSTGFNIIDVKRNYVYSRLLQIITLNCIKLFKGFCTRQYLITAKKCTDS